VNGLSRWLKFNAVGFGGILVQLTVLMLLTSGWGMNYVLATVLAVEAAVVHNYFWHQRYTWSDRAHTTARWRFLKFNLTSGIFSIGGNIAIMSLLAGKLHYSYLLASAISIAVCSIANFFTCDCWCF
jgi:putative flippase GtrA